ncbi:9978_t:CDS:2 [Entrophospora sp. SA101]|nr:9978_t:CDS:2 [Entrophospora sp. SA101]
MSRAEYNINRRLERTGGHNRLNRVIDAERPYDSISMIFDGETPIQWACRVRIALQELCSWGGPRSTFHQYCLHATYTQGANFDKHNYSRGRLYEDGTAICFRCMKLMHVNVNLDQIKIRLNKEYAEYIKKYNRYPGNAEFEISWYRKYYIPDNNNWIYYKKSQLRSRFQKRLLEIEA